MKKVPAVLLGCSTLALVVMLVMQAENRKASTENENTSVSRNKTTIADGDSGSANLQRDKDAADETSRDRKFVGEIRSEELDLLVAGSIDSKMKAFDELFREVNGEKVNIRNTEKIFTPISRMHCLTLTKRSRSTRHRYYMCWHSHQLMECRVLDFHQLMAMNT